MFQESSKKANPHRLAFLSSGELWAAWRNPPVVTDGSDCSSSTHPLLRQPDHHQSQASLARQAIPELCHEHGIQLGKAANEGTPLRLPMNPVGPQVAHETVRSCQVQRVENRAGYRRCARKTGCDKAFSSLSSMRDVKARSPRHGDCHGISVVKPCGGC